MDYQMWSYLLTAVGITGFLLAGQKIWWAWYINIGCQALWFSYAIISQQFGFVVGACFYTIVFTMNAWKWTKEHRQEKKEKRWVEAWNKGDQKFLEDM